jgi:DNA primase
LSTALDYVEATLGEGTYHNTSKGAQYSYCCPFCNDHKERLFVNVDRQVFHCHHCETSGTLITFISMLTGITWHDALNIYREYQGQEYQLPDSLEREVYDKLTAKVEVEQEKYIHPLPDEFVLLEEAKGKAGRMAVKYAKSRGITMSVAEKHYVGYCAEGKYANRIIMPDFEQGELVYWQARTWEAPSPNPLLKKHYRKVLNPSLTPEQIEDGVIAVDKSEVISNIDYVLQDGVAVICEGKMDSYSIGDYGAAIHGKHMSDAQLMKLVKNKDKIETVYVMLDGDAFPNAIALAKRLDMYLNEVRVCRMPSIKDDPGSIGRKGILHSIKESEKYGSMFHVKCQLRGWV